jgi:hypothetical protein
MCERILTHSLSQAFHTALFIILAIGLRPTSAAISAVSKLKFAVAWANTFLMLRTIFDFQWRIDNSERSCH